MVKGFGYKDRRGQRFGRLLILEDSSKRDNRSVIWKCKCDCGELLEVSARSLINGDKKSCGCLNNESRSKIKLKDEIDNRYGRLLVIERHGFNHRGRASWLCKCDCGKTTITIGDYLRDGRKQSCGCLQLESRTGPNSHLWKNGKSREHYPLGWTGTLKEQIRLKDAYTCQACGIRQTKIKLSVHHLDENKNNIHPRNLMSLCRKCHTTIHHDKTGYWQKALEFVRCY